MSDKKCCTVEVEKTEKGLKIELFGDCLKDKLSSILSCCGGKEKEKEKSGKSR